MLDSRAGHRYADRRRDEGLPPLRPDRRRPAAAPPRLRAPAHHLGAHARHRARARLRQAPREDPPRALQVRERRPRRHPPEGRAMAQLQPRAARRRDGTDAPIQVSSTILNHVIKEQASVLTHDASMDFAASKGKSDDPEPHLERDRRPAPPRGRGARRDLARLASRSRSSSRRISSSSPPSANQAAMFIENSCSSEGRAGDRHARALLAAPVAERRRAGHQRQARGEAGRAARPGVHRLQQRHPRLHAHERGGDAPRAMVEHA